MYSPWALCSPWASCSLLGSCYPWASHCLCLTSCWWERYAGGYCSCPLCWWLKELWDTHSCPRKEALRGASPYHAHELVFCSVFLSLFSSFILAPASLCRPYHLGSSLHRSLHVGSTNSSAWSPCLHRSSSSPHCLPILWLHFRLLVTPCPAHPNIAYFLPPTSHPSTAATWLSQLNIHVLDVPGLS